MNRRQLALLVTTVMLVGPAVYSLSRSEPATPSVLTLVSAGYRLDKIYHSMEGPWSVQSDIKLEPRVSNHQSKIKNSPFVWITGLETQVVDAADQKPVSQEFFCHSNLTFAENSGSPEKYNAQLGGKTHLDWRLFTLAPGRSAIDLPPNFGVPVPADAPLDYVTMSLNLNPRTEAVNVRLRTNVHTIAPDQPGAPTKALFRRALYVLHREGESGTVAHACNVKPYASATGAPQHIGAGCGELTAINLPDGSAAVTPSKGMTNHWVVPKGHHVYTTEITPQLNLPFDTTIHYATIHVHPFARKMELRDLTTGQTILRLHSHDWPDRLGVAQVDEFKSIDGLPILRDHRYELSAEYDNTSGSNTDAMAILYLYLLEKNV